MHEGMQHDPIQSQGQGHDSRALQSLKSGCFQKLSSLPFTNYNGSWQLIPRILQVEQNI